MPNNPFDVLIGLRLSIVRRAVDMLVLHFGDIRPHPSGEGTIGKYALLALSNGYALLVFPASYGYEAWRLFAPGSDADHLVFPRAGGDFAVSRRKKVRLADLEVWLRLVAAPQGAGAIEAPPTVILAAEGTRYRCGRCGNVLVIAESGALKGFIVHCRQCNRYNEVPL